MLTPSRSRRVFAYQQPCDMRKRPRHFTHQCGDHATDELVDTARNGKVVRGSWSSWCNIKGAGLGPRPQASPIPLAARFDTGCKSVDSMPNAPEGGQWFAEHFIDMVRNAEPKL